MPEEISWLQVRYDDYAFIAAGAVPAARGHRTTFTIRTLADALPGTDEPYTEIDKITLRRKAGRIRSLILPTSSESDDAQSPVR